MSLETEIVVVGEVMNTQELIEKPSDVSSEASTQVASSTEARVLAPAPGGEALRELTIDERVSKFFRDIETKTPDAVRQIGVLGRNDTGMHGIDGFSSYGSTLVTRHRTRASAEGDVYGFEACGSNGHFTLKFSMETGTSVVFDGIDGGRTSQGNGGAMLEDFLESFVPRK